MNMDFSKLKRIYFLGIGGIGMSALARYFLWLGKEVSGYDRTCTELTQSIENEGVVINYEDHPGSIPEEVDLVIYTPAIPKDSKQLNYLINSGIPMLKRAQVLGMIAANHPTIAVAGTHGKTSVTTILAHIFKSAGIEFMAFLGGISTNYNTNFLHSDNPQWVIVEADEYDRSFLQLHPDIAIITSMDADHLDIYGSVGHLEESFRLFIGNLKTNGTLITKNTTETLRGAFINQQYYGLQGDADFRVDQVEVSGGRYSCQIIHQEVRHAISFGWAGLHNLENALAATAAAAKAGISWGEIGRALADFKGVKRRFEMIIDTPKLSYIDDYAHHPEEIKTCIKSVKQMFPGKKVTGIFQPHLFSRTRDFEAEFGASLDLLDQAVVMDIYPARELPIPGVSAHSILGHMSITEKHFVPDDQILDFVSNNSFEVLITMGAGNIDKFVKPIKSILEKR
jgi:UDP-N-acetylmuramate--alanine ligase